MEASLPVVATRVGGVPDLIESGVQGLLVERRDPAGLAGAVAELLDDPEPAARMGESGRQRQRAEFDIGVTVNEIERIYVGLAEGRSAAQLAAEVGSAAGVQG
jgi:starch synthase